MSCAPLTNSGVLNFLIFACGDDDDDDDDGDDDGADNDDYFHEVLLKIEADSHSSKVQKANLRSEVILQFCAGLPKEAICDDDHFENGQHFEHFNLSNI